jgi:hypothetical protein
VVGGGGLGIGFGWGLQASPGLIRPLVGLTPSGLSALLRVQNGLRGRFVEPSPAWFAGISLAFGLRVFLAPTLMCSALSRFGDP